MDEKNENINKAVALLKLLSHPVRLSILCNLLQRGEMSVGEIVDAEEGGVGQSQVSQFLKKMRDQDLISSRKHAQMVYYKIKSVHAQKVIEALYQIYCDKGDS